MVEKKEEPKSEKLIAVVEQLPTQQLREVEMDNKQYECLTVNEALTEMLSILRDLHKKL